MRAFDYSSATTLSDAASLLDGRARALAGGTDLLPLMKLDVAAPEHLLDIKRIPDLRAAIEPSGDGLRIGALTTLSMLESDPLVAARFTALAEAAGLAASPQLRNMATLGGNLLQRPRCWYFRSSLFHCWLKGGAECHARDGENQYHAILGDSPCVAVHPSDPPAALLLFDAVIHTSRRQIPAREFFVEPSDSRRTENILEPDELIVAVTLPPARGRSTYRKAMNRKVWAFALVGVAVRLAFEASPPPDDPAMVRARSRPSDRTGTVAPAGRGPSASDPAMLDPLAATGGPSAGDRFATRAPAAARGQSASGPAMPDPLAATARQSANGPIVTDARIVLNGVSTIPYRVEAAERALIGQSLTESRINAAAEAAIHSAHPLSHNAYKLPLTQGLLRQALMSLSPPAP